MKVREKVVREYWRSLRHLYCGLVYLIARTRGRPLSLTTIMDRQGSDKGTVHGYRNGLFAGHAFTRFPSPFLTPEEQAMIGQSLVVEAIHVGDERHPGTLAILRKRQ